MYRRPDGFGMPAILFIVPASGCKAEKVPPSFLPGGVILSIQYQRANKTMHKNNFDRAIPFAFGHRQSLSD